MQKFEYGNKVYSVDDDGFLVDPGQWDEGFAEGMAQRHGISGGLKPEHWLVINFIRKYYKENGTSPPVYETCRAHGLTSTDIARLFPSGYQRGACKLAGLSYHADNLYLARSKATTIKVPLEQRVYNVDILGYLIDPSLWDLDWACYKMREMKMPEPTKKHTDILQYLRSWFKKTKEIPTVYQTCEDNGIDLEELEKLFPDGYHRGAVKVAGLPSLARMKAGAVGAAKPLSRS